MLMFVGSFGGGAIRHRGGLLEALHWEFLAYGHGAGFSNITFWVGTALFVGAWFLLGRRVVAGQTNAAELTRTLCWWVLPLVFAAPMMSRDIYSYLMQGALLRDGFDPYTQGASANPGDLLFEVSHDWRNTTTPYGPLHLWIGKIITTIFPGSIAAQIAVFKILSVLGFATIAWSVPRIATMIGGDPAFALWLGVLNPVMVFHLIGGMHNEAIMVGLVSVGLVAALRGRFFLGVLLIAIGMSLKATAAIALPFVVWIVVARATGRAQKLKTFCFYAIAGAIETIAVLAVVTWLSGASWGWIEALTGNSKVINPLALPSLIAGIAASVGGLFIEPFPYNAVLAVVRAICMIAMVIGLVVCWWIFRKTQRDAIKGTTAAYTVAFIFNAVTLPWYYASVLSILGTFKMQRPLRSFVIGASFVVAMAFTGSGNHQLYNPVWMTILVLIAWYMTREIHRCARPKDQGQAQES
ncbi:alpha-(1-_6)-mannopyranosyltransferase A [Corynebacterium gerontici]|nr:alpha-(1->6)-mannopyranosyltransferase A [Corynebacterium gerontici]